MNLFNNIKKNLNDINKVIYMNPKDLYPNKNQPRSAFLDQEISELAQSIRTHGIIQPILVRHSGINYQIIAGERRWRASIQLGLNEVPVIIRNSDELDSKLLALIENIQREDLTSIEEARAYKLMIELHNLTQESLAQRLGKAQSTIANKLRMLLLPSEIQQAMLEKKIHDRHGRALLSLKNEESQLNLLDEIIKKDLNARETEARVKQILEKPDEPQKSRIKFYSKDYRLALNTIRDSFQILSNTGVAFDVSEQEHGDELVLIVKIPKVKK